MKRIATLTVSLILLLGIVAGSLVAAGCGGVPSDAVATVGDKDITKVQFDQLIAQAKTQAESQGTAFPAKGSAMYREYTASAVAFLVRAEVVAQGAGKLGVSVTDKDVDAQVAQLEQAYGGEKKVLATLKKQGMTMAQLKQSMKASLLGQKVAMAVVKNVKVDDAQVRAYWQANAATYRKKAKTATYAKAKATISATLLDQARQKVWQAWLTKETHDLGVVYATSYDPAKLTASASPSASASPVSRHTAGALAVRRAAPTSSEGPVVLLGGGAHRALVRQVADHRVAADQAHAHGHLGNVAAGDDLRKGITVHPPVVHLCLDRVAEAVTRLGVALQLGDLAVGGVHLVDLEGLAAEGGREVLGGRAHAAQHAQVIACVARLGERDGAEELGDVCIALFLGLLGEDEVLVGRLALAGEGGLEALLRHRVELLRLGQAPLEHIVHQNSLKYTAAVPHTGHSSGASPITVWPQIGHTRTG
jgi:hypothetical protein